MYIRKQGAACTRNLGKETTNQKRTAMTQHWLSRTRAKVDAEKGRAKVSGEAAVNEGSRIPGFQGVRDVSGTVLRGYSEARMVKGEQRGTIPSNRRWKAGRGKASG